MCCARGATGSESRRAGCRRNRVFAGRTRAVVHERLPEFYQQKRDFFCSLLDDSRFRLRPARSTFFQIVDYGDISDEDDVALAKRWTEEVGVASIPLSVFCEQPFTGTRLRFCFAKDDDTLAAACEKLSRL